MNRKMRRKMKSQLKTVAMMAGGQNAFLNMIYNSAPTMIHEDDYVAMDCVLCGAEMKTIHDTHNPFPITEKCFAKEAHETGNKNRCCSKCNNEKVLPARLIRLVA